MWWVVGACFVFVVYTYVGYPALLWLLAKLKRSRQEPADSEVDLPSVTVVIAAHNEENNIAGRLENVLGSDYPPDKLNVVVACDGCTDNTAALASRYERVQVLEISPHRGKAAALNEAVRRATGEVIVFADARQRFARDAIRQLVTSLRHNGVGAVGGELILLDFAGAPQAMGAYWRYEKVVRGLEARVDSPIQCSGAIYAIYRRLFVPMPEGLVLDDMWVPLRIRRQGYRIALASEAKAYDTVTPSYDREFKRKVRTLAGNYQLIWAAPWLLVPIMNPLWWQFVSHKVCRLLVPYALIAMYGASWALLGEPYGAALVVAQTGYYLLGALAWSFPALAQRFRLVGLAGSFLSLNAAAAVAPFAFVLGKGRVRWERSPMMSPQTPTDEGQTVRTY
jgi:cellulose synthase/poly-beta-1,6-N-acetylglucosamine synthase-like glycosyltransferase